VIHVSTHALDRARQRLGCKDNAEARAILTGPTIQRAVEFANGVEVFVRFASGQRVAIRDGVVITVLPGRGGKGCRG
jgi:hypothetical protein